MLSLLTEADLSSSQHPAHLVLPQFLTWTEKFDFLAQIQEDACVN